MESNKLKEKATKYLIRGLTGVAVIGAAYGWFSSSMNLKTEDKLEKIARNKGKEVAIDSSKANIESYNGLEDVEKMFPYNLGKYNASKNYYLSRKDSNYLDTKKAQN